MLNDYRIFDYRIKCSFSFSFVSHSILDSRSIALRECTLEPKPDRSKSIVCSLPRCTVVAAAQVPPHPLSALSDYCFWAPYKYSATTTTVHRTQHTDRCRGSSLDRGVWRMWLSRGCCIKQTQRTSVWVSGGGISRLLGRHSVSASIVLIQLTRRHGHVKYVKLMLPTRHCRSA